MEDKILRIINARYPIDFENTVNALLAEGGWRVVQTEMSVTDHHYFAMLVKCALPAPPEASDGTKD